VKRSLPPAPHTPGPWKVYQEKPHYYSVGTDYAHDRGHDCNIVRDVRCEANARIMAAAPEMLEALEAALGWIRDGTNPSKGCINPLPGDVATLEAVQAAIRKAKGE
jgi:hypothetical protein